MQLKLGTRIGVGYGVVITTLLLVFILSMMGFELSRGQAVLIRRELFPSIAASNEMLARLDWMERTEYQSLSGELAPQSQDFETHAAAFRKGLLSATRHAYNPQEEEIVSSIGQHFGGYLNVASRLRSLVRSGRTAEARELDFTESSKAADRLREAIQTFREVNLKTILEEHAQEERILRLAEWTAGSLALLALLLAGYIWRRNVEAIVAPLQNLETAASAIAAGRFTTATHPQAERTLEIAALQHDFNAMAQEQERMTRGLEAQVAARTHELKTAMEELERLVAELRSLDKMKSDLMAVVSHELLTPINFIMAYGSTLQEEILGPLSPEQAMAIHRIVEGSERLTRMIRNVLDYTQLESGQLAVRPEQVDYASLVRDILGTMRPMALNKSQSVEEILPHELPPAWTDSSRVAQILQELLNNAIKFTSERGRIRLAVTHDDDSLITEVSDTGIGIPADIQAYLFKGFYQGDATSTRAFGGLGLGLSIAHHLISRMGGRLEVDSTPGQGSTFRFTLPRADRRPDDSPDRSGPPEMAAQLPLWHGPAL